MKLKYLIFFSFACSLLITACQNNDYSPKPRGYFRIEYPKRGYQLLNQPVPYSFHYPVYATVEADKSRDAHQDWYNLHFKQFNAYLHLTYYNVSGKAAYDEMVEDARKLAFKHTIKASAIDQKVINYPDRRVYGIYYAIEGNTASSVQFFLTDSAKHYFRGALYFNERPQYDSIAPVIKFIKTDIDTLIASFKWKN
ncbi:gliding motility lipoprotein GldD [Pedobacter rhizosphaerae]|uniref:Gliding motility-associated lipoprotein GldD n=1 Tax=Pedobacter rhizosphaerae TaxID=390241 RepID=A0A1H9V2X3_9SPHI|nr:gliding motility lipoprotein GldD [Pedobacter rhizosphaerae]SES15938.1 gliding motility-associated lipoprotein GldD [Pedobacter rhizosphaerae]